MKQLSTNNLTGWLVTLIPAIGLAACGQNHADSPNLDSAGNSPAVGAPVVQDAAKAILTKEEVGAVLGKPVTSVEGKGMHLSYHTDVMQLDTDIELEEKRDMDDAVRAIQGARTATGMLGGKPEPVANLGDEALFGAMSILYVRKGNVVITVRPPNLQQVAGINAYQKVRDAKLGSDEQRAAIANLQQVEKTDPLQVAAGTQGDNGVQGAIATINAASAKQGTDYEAQARGMALSLAAQILHKL